MSRKFFITGTDTDCGKTYISVGILNAYKQLGFSTLGIKPIASGSAPHNTDALALQQASTIKLPYEQINPFAFEPPIAPHIAATQANTTLDISTLNTKTEIALSHPADITIIEGAGGSHIPLNATETLADWVAHKNFDVILVVGMRLGCLNHAILTMRALLADHINVVGWIANCIDPHMQVLSENIQTLTNIFKSPRLSIVPQNGSIDVARMKRLLFRPGLLRSIKHRRQHCIA